MTPGKPWFSGLFFIVFAAALFTGGCRTWSSREERAAQAYNEGNAFRETGMYEDALSSYNLALKHEPEMAAATYNLALTLVELNRSEEALEHLQILNQRDPRNLKVLRALAWTAWKDEKMQTSLDYYKSVLIISPGDVAAMRGACDVYEAINQPDSAVDMRRFLLKLDENTETRMDLARTYESAERYEEAYDMYNTLLVRDPVYQEALSGASRTAEETGRFHESIMFRLQLIDMDNTDSGEQWWHIARLRLLNIGDYEGGLKALETALNEGFADEEVFDELLSSSPPAIRSAIRNLLSE